MKQSWLDWLVGGEEWWRLKGKVFGTLAIWAGVGLLLFWLVLTVAQGVTQ